MIDVNAAMIFLAAVLLAGCHSSVNHSSAPDATSSLGMNGRSTPTEAPTLDAASRDALLAALDDERRAEAFYTAVITTLGDVRPFINIVSAEQRHQELLLPILEKYGIPVPSNPYNPADFDVPATRAEACAMGATSERDNIALYDRLIPTIQPQDIKSAFQILRAASAEHHLPAFERCAGR